MWNEDTTEIINDMGTIIYFWVMQNAASVYIIILVYKSFEQNLCSLYN